MSLLVQEVRPNYRAFTAQRQEHMDSRVTLLRSLPATLASVCSKMHTFRQKESCHIWFLS